MSVQFVQMSTLSTTTADIRVRSKSTSELVTDQLETSPLDDRSYRVIKLKNGLEVLLVHDAETDKASAAMDVNVGSFNDPQDMPGLAHGVEHMLFMGTKKYAEENAYNKYLSEHSGYANATTFGTSTNYYFELAAKPVEGADTTLETELSPLYGALDRFSRFFIDPIFLSEVLDRELRAVASENKRNLQKDQRRLEQLVKSLSNPKHPYCHFATGNLETLKHWPEQKGADVRQAFMKFYDKCIRAICYQKREGVQVATPIEPRPSACKSLE